MSQQIGNAQAFWSRNRKCDQKVSAKAKGKKMKGERRRRWGRRDGLLTSTGRGESLYSRSDAMGGGGSDKAHAV